MQHELLTLFSMRLVLRKEDQVRYDEAGVLELHLVSGSLYHGHQKTKDESA
jgi:hypothetical protein